MSAVLIGGFRRTARVQSFVICCFRVRVNVGLASWRAEVVELLSFSFSQVDRRQPPEILEQENGKISLLTAVLN